MFTGKLSSLGRKDACALVAALGGTTAEDVNAKTTMVVIGAEGLRLAAGEAGEGGDEAPAAAGAHDLAIRAPREAQRAAVGDDQQRRLVGHRPHPTRGQ